MHTISSDFPLGDFPTPLALLRWYEAAGVDECMGEEALDRFALTAQTLAAAAADPAQRSRPRAPAPPSNPRAEAPPQPVAESATHIASACTTPEALRQALESFQGSPLRTGATTVFADGAEQAALMVVGLAPGPEENRQGVPFIGPEGHLLRRMLGSIGQDRSNTRFTTLFPWSLPATGFAPDPTDLAACLPFLERHIELIQPRCLLVIGEGPARALLARREGISRLRGVWHGYETAGLSHPIPLLTTYSMEQARQTPHQKREAWRHLLLVLDALRTGEPRDTR